MTKPTFFFDRCLGRRVPRALLELGSRCDFEVKYHQGESYRHNLDDDIWLSAVGQKGWFVLSYDAKWQDEAPAIAAITQHRVGCFYLHGASSLSFDRLASFVRSYDKIMQLAKNETRPFIYAFDSRNQARKIL